jgi:hypothetical protein
MSATNLENLFDSIKKQLTTIHESGGLTTATLLKLATNLVKDVSLMEGLSLEEQKGIVFSALQQGLASLGPLQNLFHTDPAVVANMAVNAVFGLQEAFPALFSQAHGLLSYIRCFLSKYLPVCSQAAAVASVVDPKAAELIAKAVESLKSATAAAPTLQVRNVETTQVSESASAAADPAQA